MTANYPTFARAYSMRVCLRVPMLMCVCCVYVKTHPSAPRRHLSRSQSPAHPCFFLSVDCRIKFLLTLSFTVSLLLIVNLLPSSFSFSVSFSSCLPLLPVDMDVDHARDCETKVVPFLHRKLCRDLQCFCQLLQMYSSSPILSSSASSSYSLDH